MLWSKTELRATKHRKTPPVVTLVTAVIAQPSLLRAGGVVCKISITCRTPQICCKRCANCKYQHLQEEMVAVRWCEAEVRAFEWTNTFSNLIFAITAYVGWRLAKERGLPFEFVAAELLLIVVFVGSVLFHGTAGASWRAELLDELPMMLLAHAYLWSVRDIHPWTRPPLWRRTLFVGAGVPIVGAVTYVWWQNYAVFINTLTFQYFLAGGIAFSASRKIGAPLRTWYWFIGTFAFGKIIWEIEQYRYREGTCPTSALNPVYWFHAGWHVFAAAAHHAAMRFHGELWVATRRKEV